MDYLKNPFVIEDSITGHKEIVNTFRRFTKLAGAHKAVAREFNRYPNEPFTLGVLTARKQEAFELV